MKVKQLSVVPDASSERVDRTWSRNVIQLTIGLTLAAVGTIIGFVIAPAPRLFGAIAGFVVGGTSGVFIVGAALAFVPQNPTLRTVVEITARYRSARRQFLICLGMIPVLAALFPILNLLDSVALWIIWAAVIAILYVNSQLVFQQLRDWQCPQCELKYGYPGLIRDLRRGGQYDCSHCDFSMFNPPRGRQQ